MDLPLPPRISAKPPAQTRVVVAMSGGVDSSVVAALYAQAGYEVVGVTLQLYDHGAAVNTPGACCAGADIRDARRVASALGIPHYVIDAEARFRAAVIDDFADSYLAGETPIPCVRCNERVKFGDLLSLARDLGADALATGHYVRKVAGPAGPELHRARDAARDQSYFLFSMTAAQLAFVEFPLGGLEKAATRAAAARLGLAVAEKPDSQDICFVPSGRYAALVAKLRPGAVTAGEIVHVDGRVLGRHAGVIHFTVGQRKGLGLAGTEPLFVVALDAAAARVIVGPRAALARREIALERVNWLGDRPLGPVVQEVAVRVRSSRAPVPAAVTCGPDGAVRVDLAAPEEGVAPGQACVFYAPDPGTRVLGGGWIARTARAGVAARSAAPVA